MSSYIDPQYTPVPGSENQFLALMPNLFDPRKPVPLNVTPDEISVMYDTLIRHCELEMQREMEEKALYQGSTNPIPADW